MLSIIDYFYSPVIWIMVNIGILLGIIFVVRTTNKVKKMHRELIWNKYFQELLSALRKNVEMSQKELASFYAEAIIKYISSIGLVKNEQSQTFKELIEQLRHHKFTSEEDLNVLVHLYERARFSNEVLDMETLEKLRLTIMKVAKSIKTYFETQFHAKLPTPSEDLAQGVLRK